MHPTRRTTHSPLLRARLGGGAVERSEARSLCPLVVSWAAPGERHTDCACADCSSCRGAPGCASAKRWRWPKATSIRHAERSWCAAVRAASPAKWEWTNGPRCRCSPGWPSGRGASRSTVVRQLRPNVRAATVGGWDAEETSTLLPSPRASAPGGGGARPGWVRSRPRSAPPVRSPTPEDDDQRYLHKGDPGLGSCGQVATCVACRVGVGVRTPPAA